MFPSRNIITSGSPGLVVEKSINFDGSEQRIEIPDSTTFDTDNGTETLWSVSLWFKKEWFSLPNDARCLIYKGAPSKIEFELREYNGIIYLSQTIADYAAGTSNSTGNTSTGVVITDDNWHHVVCSYKGSVADRVLIWVDGVDEYSAGGHASYDQRVYSNDGPFSIGGANKSDINGFLGKIDQVFWMKNYRITQTDVDFLYSNGTPPADLSGFLPSVERAWYRLGEDDNPGGSFIKDELGSNHGTLIGNSTYPISSVVPPRNIADPPYGNEYALSFDGTGDYASIAHTTGLNHDYTTFSRFSIAFWARVDDITAAHGFIGKATSTSGANHEYSFRLISGNFKFYIGDGSNKRENYISSSGISNDTWFHILITYDGYESTEADRAKIYLNGTTPTQNGSADNPAEINDVDAPLAFGSLLGNAANGVMTGYMDEIFYINEIALTATDRDRLYNSGNPPYLLGYKGDRDQQDRFYWQCGDNTTGDANVKTLSGTTNITCNTIEYEGAEVAESLVLNGDCAVTTTSAP